MAPQKPDTCDKILLEIQLFINSSSEQMSGRVTMGKLQRVRFSRDKGKGGGGRKNPTTKTNKKCTPDQNQPAVKNVMTLSYCGVKPAEHIAICQDSPGFC